MKVLQKIPFETSHLDNGRCNFYKLVDPRLIFTGALPHITEDQTKLYFFFHFCYLDFTLFYNVTKSYFPLLYSLGRGNVSLTTSNLTDYLLENSHCAAINGSD